MRYLSILFAFALCFALNAESANKSCTKDLKQPKQVKEIDYSKKAEVAANKADKYLEKAKKAEENEKTDLAEAYKKAASSKKALSKAYKKIEKGKEKFVEAKAEKTYKEQKIDQTVATYNMKELAEYLEQYSKKVVEEDKKGNTKAADEYDDMVEGLQKQITGLHMIEQAKHNCTKAKKQIEDNK